MWASTSASRRKYDIVVFGATGYTGKLTSEAVLGHTPSTTRWAIAGRALQKLELLAHEYNRLYPDRVPVEVLVADLNESSLERLAQSTRLLITTVGPFVKYGTAVLEACAVYGTHYVDSTGESPWVYEMVKKCHRTARAKKAIMIPQCGFDSAPVDLGTYALAKTIRDELDEGVSEVTFSVHDLKASVSGGTFETMMSLFEVFTLQELFEASRHDALSPVKGPEQPWRWPIIWHKELGLLTSWLNCRVDRSQVFRSWGLMDAGKYYGQDFTWNEYMRASNPVSAIFYFFIVNIISFVFMFAPFRWLARRLAKHSPGEGPPEEVRRKNRVEWRGVAVADGDSPNPRKAFVTIEGSDPYCMTALVMVKTALAILYDPDTLARKLGGGILTPATLATPAYFRELDRAGIRIEARLL